MKVLLPIYDYADKSTKIWIANHEILKGLKDIKIKNYIPMDETLQVSIATRINEKGFNEYHIEKSLFKWQRIRKLFFDFFKNNY